MTTPSKPIVCAAILVAGATVLDFSAQAAEQGQSVYLLGSKGSMAGIIPPPGSYFADANYYYSGSTSGQAALGVQRQLGRLVRDN